MSEKDMPTSSRAVQTHIRYISLPEGMTILRTPTKDLCVNQEILKSIMSSQIMDNMILYRLIQDMESEAVLEVIQDMQSLLLMDTLAKHPDTIDLQNVIKETLNRGFQNKRCQTMEGITIYAQKPTLSENLFAYEVVDNGKQPTCSDPSPMSSVKTAYSSKYGSIWYHTTNLSPQRLQQVLERREETRENRRHTGDSPSPT